MLNVPLGRSSWVRWNSCDHWPVRYVRRATPVTGMFTAAESSRSRRSSREAAVNSVQRRITSVLGTVS